MYQMSFRSTTMARSWEICLILAAILEGENSKFYAETRVKWPTFFLFEHKVRDNLAVNLKYFFYSYFLMLTNGGR